MKSDAKKLPGEDLLESEDLKRQLREARQREGLSEPPRQEPVE